MDWGRHKHTCKSTPAKWASFLEEHKNLLFSLTALVDADLEAHPHTTQLALLLRDGTGREKIQSVQDTLCYIWDTPGEWDKAVWSSTSTLRFAPFLCLYQVADANQHLSDMLMSVCADEHIPKIMSDHRRENPGVYVSLQQPIVRRVTSGGKSGLFMVSHTKFFSSLREMFNTVRAKAPALVLIDFWAVGDSPMLQSLLVVCNRDATFIVQSYPGHYTCAEWCAMDAPLSPPLWRRCSSPRPLFDTDTVPAPAMRKMMPSDVFWDTLNGYTHQLCSNDSSEASRIQAYTAITGVTMHSIPEPMVAAVRYFNMQYAFPRQT